MQTGDALHTLYRNFDRLLAEIYPHEEKVPVYGEGDPHAAVMFIGEAPGEQETLQRRPFVGRAGQNLQEVLQLMGLAREALFVTNVVKFRPYKVHPVRGTFSNRPPTREEVALCRHVLLQEIALVRPRVIVTLGNTALRAVCDDGHITIGQVHGTLLPRSDGYLYPMYHPASIIYNRELKDVFTEDAIRLGQELTKTASL